MEPTLDVGDFIVVTKWSYGYNRHSLMFDPPFLRVNVCGRASPSAAMLLYLIQHTPRADQNIVLLKAAAIV